LFKEDGIFKVPAPLQPPRHQQQQAHIPVAAGAEKEELKAD
jgi:hypothetical protein